MCGLVCLIGTNNHKSYATNMLQMIKHRGPDHQAVKQLKLNWLFVDLGHARLSIVDHNPLSVQPMSYMDRYEIVFNGEIYNYLSIKETLIKRGYNFVSTSDTEVLIAAYDCYGIEALNMFNGMWAFVLIDKKEKQIIVSRDRFGKKPMYYFQNKDILLFASEIKALLAHPMVDKKPNMTYCKRYLDIGAVEYEHSTAFDGIYRILHNHYVILDFDKFNTTLNQKSYWDIHINDSCEEFNEHRCAEYAKQYLDILRDAVDIRLKSDVIVGATLSGGLDSSSIVSTMTDSLDKHSVETFSCVYKTKNVSHCDESHFIDKLGKFLNVKNYQIEPDEHLVIKQYESSIFFHDTPPNSSTLSAWNTYSLIANSDVTVVLEGQGADEQLGGYERHLVAYLANSKYADKELENLIKTYGKRKVFNLAYEANLLKQKFGTKSALEYYQQNRHDNVFENLNIRFINECRSTLVNLLHFGDRHSMAFSKESRMPFLDYRLVEFLASVPYVYKIHKGIGKYLARVAMDGKLPQEIVWRKDKMGWPIPEDYWFRIVFREYVIKQISSSNLLKEIGLELDIERTIDNNELSTLMLIRMLNLSVWHRLFFESNLQEVSEYARENIAK